MSHGQRLRLANIPEDQLSKYAGLYECCIRESLGNVCYGTRLIYVIPDYLGIQVNNGDVIELISHQSVVLRLGLHDPKDTFSCSVNGSTTPAPLKFSATKPLPAAGPYLAGMQIMKLRWRKLIVVSGYVC
ncbi:unnamed protein product, partial [Mesorhabditis spiculigera]